MLPCLLYRSSNMDTGLNNNYLRWTLWLTTVVLLCNNVLATEIQVLLPVRPENIAVLVNSDVTLECKVTQTFEDPYLTWDECISAAGGGDCTRISLDDNMGLYLENGGEPDRNARYSIVNPVIGQYNLKIAGAQMEDGGKYRCMSVLNSNMYAYVEVIMIEKNPECGSNFTAPSTSATEPDEVDSTPDLTPVEAWCNTSYTGRWAPVTHFMKDNDVITEADDGADLANFTDATGADYSIVYTQQPGDGGKLFQAQTYFLENPVEQNEARNIPSFKHTVRFGTFSAAAPVTTTPGVYIMSTLLMSSTLMLHWS